MPLIPTSGVAELVLLAESHVAEGRTHRVDPRKLHKAKFGHSPATYCFLEDLRYSVDNQSEPMAFLAGKTDVPEWIWTYRESLFEGLNQVSANHWHIESIRVLSGCAPYIEPFHRLLLNFIRDINLRHEPSREISKPLESAHRIGPSTTPQRWKELRDMYFTEGQRDLDYRPFSVFEFMCHNSTIDENHGLTLWLEIEDMLFSEHITDHTECFGGKFIEKLPRITEYLRTSYFTAFLEEEL